MDCAALDRGIALFNQQRYFAAHEIWEGAWIRSEGQDKLFLQFLIQSAAALLHAERGNARGAQAVWSKARAKLASLPDIFLGMDLERVSASINEALSPGLRKKELPLLRRDAV